MSELDRLVERHVFDHGNYYIAYLKGTLDPVDGIKFYLIAFAPEGVRDRVVIGVHGHRDGWNFKIESLQKENLYIIRVTKPERFAEHLKRTTELLAEMKKRVIERFKEHGETEGKSEAAD